MGNCYCIKKLQHKKKVVSNKCQPSFDLRNQPVQQNSAFEKTAIITAKESERVVPTSFNQDNEEKNFSSILTSKCAKQPVHKAEKSVPNQQQQYQQQQQQQHQKPMISFSSQKIQSSPQSQGILNEKDYVDEEQENQLQRQLKYNLSKQGTLSQREEKQITMKNDLNVDKNIFNSIKTETEIQKVIQDSIIQKDNNYKSSLLQQLKNENKTSTLVVANLQSISIQYQIKDKEEFDSLSNKDIDRNIFKIDQLQNQNKVLSVDKDFEEN